MYVCMYGGKFELRMMHDGTLHFMWAVQTTRTWRIIRIHWFQVQVCHFLQGRGVGVIHLVHLALYFLLIIFMFSKKPYCLNIQSLIWYVWETRNQSYYRGVTYFTMWQIGSPCHNTEVPRENAHYVLFQVHKTRILSNVFTNMQVFLMKSMWTLKKESLIQWCCHFRSATYIVLSFSDTAYNFITFIGVNYDGVVHKKI